MRQPKEMGASSMGNLHVAAIDWRVVPVATALVLALSSGVASAQEPPSAPGQPPSAATPPASLPAPPAPSLTPKPAPAPAQEEPGAAAPTIAPPAVPPAAPPAPPPVVAPVPAIPARRSPAPAPTPLAAAPETNEADTDASWFARPAFSVSQGRGNRRWTLTFFGFVEADFITDSTRSYGDAINGAVVARDDTYAGRAGRTQFSMRNTRLGLMFEAPATEWFKPSALLEGDFFGSQPSSVSEGAFFDSPAFRLRHGYLKLESPVIDVLVGQTYDLFGWQNEYFPCTAEFLGLPNQTFSRSAQLRLSRSVRLPSGLGIDLAIAAVRPAQRDSQLPDAHAGLRISFDGWQGITTPGNVGTRAAPLSIGVSGVVRRFKVDAFTPPPPQTSNSVSGWGISLDALVPVIPTDSAGSRGNRLTLVGSYVVGTGIADLIDAGGGAQFPTLPNPQQSNPPPMYTPDVDNGLVTFDTIGILHTIDWKAFKLGLQYYLPPAGRVIVSANYTEAHSNNMQALFPMGGAEIELLNSIVDTSRYADVNLFWDATPEVRLGLSGQYTYVEYLGPRGNKPHNLRGMAQALYVF
jgi:hypothetical protein